ncbi:MAG: alpha/beta hydrolase [Candidatus Brennerbacteria bacterium]
MKRVFIVHGWDGYPEEGWFPWLKKELEAKGFEVYVPQMPDAAHPRIEKWVPALAEAVGATDEQTYFVGHSMGVQTIVRYLESLPGDEKVGGAVFVGGYFKRLTGIEEEGEEVVAMAHHWLDVSPDLQKVKSHLPASIAIFSDDDPYVPLDNQDDFRDKLGSEILTLSKRGHFSGSTGTIELPEARDALLTLADAGE